METLRRKKGLEFSNSSNSMSMSNSSAKENANEESKNENESAIQYESQKFENFMNSLFNIGKCHSNNIIMAHINTISLRNNVNILTNNVNECIDILMTSKTKLEDTFPHTLYHLSKFSNRYRLNRNSHGS